MPKPVAKYRDLNLSFLSHPVKKDVSTLSDVDAVSRSLRNLIMTNYYERPFHPEIGSNVRYMLFENISSITANGLQRSIQDVIQNFEPRVKLNGVTVVVDPDANGYTATIQFYMANVSQLQSVDFYLERLR